MTHERALLLALATFVVFGAAAVALLAVLDVSMVYVIGPLVAVAIASVLVHRTARGR
ncbi:hypothetical protein GCM10023340_13770 [Nocardioides marinquilinus]|uniref:Uncharacterized protein n=1 Tax=Nocardioides marinquilinus TaxID=1210400 RepID=A0ABP9PKE0_9ACTN